MMVIRQNHPYLHSHFLKQKIMRFFRIHNKKNWYLKNYHLGSSYLKEFVNSSAAEAFREKVYSDAGLSVDLTQGCVFEGSTSGKEYKDLYDAFHYYYLTERIWSEETFPKRPTNA